jgi:hypothetical protein
MPRSRAEIESQRADLEKELAELGEEKEEIRETRDQAKVEATRLRAEGLPKAALGQERIAKASSDELAEVSDLIRALLKKLRGKDEGSTEVEKGPEEKRGLFDGFFD